MVTYRFVQKGDQLHVPEQFVPGHGQAMELTHLHKELAHSLPVKCKNLAWFLALTIFKISVVAADF